MVHQHKTHFKKGDRVKITTGNLRGKEGVIAKLDRVRRLVFIEGIVMKKHVKPSQQNEQGSITEVPRGLDWSNVMLIDLKNRKVTTRIRYRWENGKKVRFAVRSKTKLK